jgi:protein tyrosine phosphatase (PTP) superfamily phosphohydrolase (DUF442 family)
MASRRLRNGHRRPGLLAALCAVFVLLPALTSCEEREADAEAPRTPAPREAETPAVPEPVPSAEVEPASAAAPAAQEEGAGRDPRWAVPLEEPGLPNLHKVTDGLYRSAQPTAEGMQRAREMGIETVVNLRSFHSDRDEIGETGLAYEHIYMKAWHPEDEEVVRFLQIATDPDRQPVLVHCQHGADRTGTMCAAYRIAVEGWAVEDAVEEMTEGGYGFHDVWEGTLLDYLRELHYEEIRRRTGLTEDEPPAETKEETDAE